MGETAAVLASGLGCILVTAGLLKIVTRQSPADLLTSLGWSSQLAEAIARITVVAELALGINLLIGFDRSPAASGALVILTTGFLAVLARALQIRARARCSCFGNLDDAPISPLTLVRAALVWITSLIVLALSSNMPGYGMRLTTTMAGALAAATFMAAFAMFDQVYGFEARTRAVQASISDSAGRRAT